MVGKAERLSPKLVLVLSCSLNNLIIDEFRGNSVSLLISTFQLFIIKYSIYANKYTSPSPTVVYVKNMKIKTLGIGIWGTGVIAEFHAQALSEIPNVKLIAAYNHHRLPIERKAEA